MTDNANKKTLKRRSNSKDENQHKAPIEITGIKGGSIKKGCVIGARNLKIKRPIENPLYVVALDGGDHDNVKAIGLDGATLGGSSGDDEDFNDDSFFGGNDTGALLIAGKTRPKDGNVFLNDLEDLTVKMREFGIKDKHIFKVTPQGQGYQIRNITRAVEDLIDLGIKKLILFYAGHCNKEQEFHLDNRDPQGCWYPHQDLKKSLQALPVTKMLIILDTCFSGSLDMGARGEDVKDEGGLDRGQKRGREVDGDRRVRGLRGGGGNNSEEDEEEAMLLDSDEEQRGSEKSQGQRKRMKGPCDQNSSNQPDNDGNGTRAIGVAGSDEEGDTDELDLGDDSEMDDDDDDDDDELWVEPFDLPQMPCFWDIFEGMMDECSRSSADTQAVQWCSSSRDQESHNHGGGRNGVFTNAILETIEAMSLGKTTSVMGIHKKVFRKIKLRQTPILKPDMVHDLSSGYMKRFPKFRRRASYVRNMQ